ncbi:Dirigent protein [Linum perenne]
MALFFHDIIYNGRNKANATAAIVAAPEGSNKTILAGEFHFGNIAIFDDPITLDNNLHSPPVGRAQGMYMYDTKNTFTAWLGFTFCLNSTHHHGTINFVGADPLMNKTRDVSIVGGTVYFRLRVDMKFYECW